MTMLDGQIRMDGVVKGVVFVAVALVAVSLLGGVRTIEVVQGDDTLIMGLVRRKTLTVSLLVTGRPPLANCRADHIFPVDYPILVRPNGSLMRLKGVDFPKDDLLCLSLSILGAIIPSSLLGTKGTLTLLATTEVKVFLS